MIMLNDRKGDGSRKGIIEVSGKAQSKKWSDSLVRLLLLFDFLLILCRSFDD